MASKTMVILTDDLDGSEATETIEFAIDGAGYEIDLNEENAEALRDALEPWIHVARRSGGRQRPTPGRRPRVSGHTQGSNGELSKEERNHLRSWAANNGYEVADRGRIAQEVVYAWISAGRLES